MEPKTTTRGKVACLSFYNNQTNRDYSFAYIFFSTPEEAAKGVAMSEKKLEGRSLLIKDSENFERADGSKAPTEAEKKEIKKQKNPPCPTLFLGNLSFDTTEKSIRENFEWAGEIRKVRVATFEDSGKCKGFGYVDYHEVESATKAIRAPDKHMLDGRKVRVEFGSAEAHMRSKPWLMREKQKAERPHNTSTDAAADSTAAPATFEENPYKRQRREQNEGGENGEEKREFRERRPKKAVSHEKVKPGQALYAAQRQKPSVQEFKGTKVTFD
jgi:RNA recognition motif-containing protein